MPNKDLNKLLSTSASFGLKSTKETSLIIQKEGILSSFLAIELALVLLVRGGGGAINWKIISIVPVGSKKDKKLEKEKKKLTKTLTRSVLNLFLNGIDSILNWFS